MCGISLVHSLFVTICLPGSLVLFIFSLSLSLTLSLSFSLYRKAKAAFRARMAEAKTFTSVSGKKTATDEECFR